MKSNRVWRLSLAVIGLLVAAQPLRAAVDDFKLMRCMPADSMLAVHARDHDGRAFVNQQMQRVWNAVEAQDFGKDLKRLLRGLVESQDGADVEKFETQWQQISDAVAGVEWAKLAEREFAFGMKFGPPTGSDFVFMFMAAPDNVQKNFEALAALLKNLAGLEPQELKITTEGTGDSVLHRLTISEQVPPVSISLARHKDVILLGFGTGMIEQSLALLRGESDPAKAALAATERYKQALKRLPAPQDSVVFVDINHMFGAGRAFAKMFAGPAGDAAGDGPSPAAIILPLIDAVDLWDYAVTVESTAGLKTTSESAVVLREESRDLPLRKALYSNKPLQNALKYVPVEATAVSATSGIDFAATYAAILDFVKKNVPEGEQGLAEWKAQQAAIEFDVEQDLLSWLGGGFTTFSAARAAYASEWAWIVDIRDEAKANAALDKIATRLNDALASNNGAVEDAKLEEAPGFKRVILPAIAAMLPGLGRPVFGVKDGHLFVANSPEIVKLALEVGAGKHDNFTKSERYQKECLPLGDNASGFQYQDLSKLGDQLGQAFAMVGMFQMMMPPEAAKNPMVKTAINVISKLGRVVKQLDFYRSSCEVSTFDGKVSTTKKLVNYQEPPKPTTEPAPGDASPGAAPEKPKTETPKAEKPKASDAPKAADQPKAGEKPGASKGGEKPAEKPKDKKPGGH
jgi:hypothetical protein